MLNIIEEIYTYRNKKSVIQSRKTREKSLKYYKRLTWSIVFNNVFKR